MIKFLRKEASIQFETLPVFQIKPYTMNTSSPILHCSK